MGRFAFGTGIAVCTAVRDRVAGVRHLTDGCLEPEKFAGTGRRIPI